jgi:hypothetical protein
VSGDDPRPAPVQSFVMETNYGGVAVTVCACGVLLFHSDMAWNHIDACPVLLHPEGGPS